MSLIDELLGTVRPKLRGHRRLVPLTGEPLRVELAKDLEHKAKVSRKNARAYANLKRDTERLEKRRARERKWRADNPVAMSSYRAAWIMRNPEENKRIQRQSHRRSYKPVGLARGERNAATKLNATQVQEIRVRYAAGGISFLALGAAYGVSFTNVRKIVRRETWAEV